MEPDNGSNPPIPGAATAPSVTDSARHAVAANRFIDHNLAEALSRY